MVLWLIRCGVVGRWFYSLTKMSVPACSTAGLPSPHPGGRDCTSPGEWVRQEGTCGTGELPSPDPGGRDQRVLSVVFDWVDCNWLPLFGTKFFAYERSPQPLFLMFIMYLLFSFWNWLLFFVWYSGLLRGNIQVVSVCIYHNFNYLMFSKI